MKSTARNTIILELLSVLVFVQESRLVFVLFCVKLECSI